MSEEENPKYNVIERFRFAIIGSLLAAPPEPGQLQQRLRDLSQQKWQHPKDPHRKIKLSFSTLERWYYAALNTQDPVRSLRRQKRRDAGKRRATTLEVEYALKKQYQEFKHWSVQLHYDNLKALSKKDKALTPLPSYSSITRLMRSLGWFKKPKRKANTEAALNTEKRLEQREVRSYEVEHVSGLWHLDFHKGSLQIITQSGVWATPILLGIIDDRSRFICHMQWYLAETAENLVHGFSQALQKQGLPRALMSDNGSAMRSQEFTQGLHRLGIQWDPTMVYAPFQNGKQECFWGTVEGRLLNMLDHIKDLTLQQLNEYSQIWVLGDYHKNKHKELGVTPLHCFLKEKSVVRPCPELCVLKRAFRYRARRKQRRSDGTISLCGKRFEVPNAYRHLEHITIAYARWDLSTLEMVDPETNDSIAVLLPLDKAANADSQRRIISACIDTDNTQSNKSMPPLLEKLLEEHASTGLPVAYLPKDELK